MSQEIVNTRNITALAESARQERDRADALHGRVVRLEALVAALQSEVATMRMQLALALASSAGRGPTDRGAR
jgi:hypothetical protein